MTINIDIEIDERNQLAIIEFTQNQQLYAGATPIDVTMTGTFDKEELWVLISDLEQAYDQLQ
jgi:hypothetical protein